MGCVNSTVAAAATVTTTPNDEEKALIEKVEPSKAVSDTQL